MSSPFPAASAEGGHRSRWKPGSAGAGGGERRQSFGAAQTQERYATAFCRLFLGDRTNCEGRAPAGGARTAERARHPFKAVLGAFIARRREARGGLQ